jgi:hypothetical protein
MKKNLEIHEWTSRQFKRPEAREDVKGNDI